MTTVAPATAKPATVRPRQGWADLVRVLDVRAEFQLVVPTLQIPVGPVTLAASSPLVVADGAILQRVILGNRIAATLLGPGDVLWADRDRGGPWQHVTRALTPTTLAAVGRVPPRRRAMVDLVLLDVAERQAVRLAHQAVLGQLIALEDRLAAMLPQIADRWGVMTSHGVVLPRFLKHWVLAELVSVRRPSLTTAVQRMERDGRLHRQDDGRWLLGGGVA